MKAAICHEQDRTEFVELFLENGFSFKKHLTYGTLLDFYNKVIFNKLILFNLTIKEKI